MLVPLRLNSPESNLMTCKSLFVIMQYWLSLPWNILFDIISLYPNLFLVLSFQCGKLQLHQIKRYILSIQDIQRAPLMKILFKVARLISCINYCKEIIFSHQKTTHYIIKMIKITNYLIKTKKYPYATRFISILFCSIHSNYFPYAQ